jgi:hypothetical protein
MDEIIIQVLQSGAPVLGCAQPSCVISASASAAEQGSPKLATAEDSQFLMDANGQADGFFREIIFHYPYRWHVLSLISIFL